MPISNPPVTVPNVADIILELQTASGATAPTYAGGAWTQVTLNTLVRNNIGASLASGKLTIPAGLYRYRKQRLFGNGGRDRIRDTTNSVTLAQNSLNDVTAASYDPAVSISEGGFLVAGSVAIEIDVYSSTGSGGFLYAAIGTGDVEYYYRFELWKS